MITNKYMHFIVNLMLIFNILWRDKRSRMFSYISVNCLSFVHIHLYVAVDLVYTVGDSVKMGLTRP